MIFRRLEDNFDLTTSFECFGSFPYNSMYHVKGKKDKKTYLNSTAIVQSNLIGKNNITNNFRIFTFKQSLQDVFYQNVDGARIFIGINFLDSLKNDSWSKQRLDTHNFAILPLFLSIEIKYVLKMKNMGRFGHFDWDAEIITVEGNL